MNRRSKEIYEYRFDELLKLYKRDKTELHIGKSEKKSDMLIDISGDAFRKYSKIVDANERWVIYTIEQIIRNLLQAYEIIYEIPEYEEITLSGKRRKIHPFAFSKENNGKKVAYIFRYKLSKSLREIHNFLDSFKDIDAVKIFFIRNDYSNEIKLYNDIETEKYGSYIEFAQIREFFLDEFDENEYNMFVNCAAVFNAKARNLIGLATVEMPTEKTVKKFRYERAELIKTFPYITYLPNGIDETQRKLIYSNFMTQKRYRLLTSISKKCNFAHSFISSEWYYNQHTTTGVLEQTAIVVGYLKSVEQLLYLMIRYWINKNKWIKINGKYEDSFTGIIHVNGLIDFVEANEKYIDKTLGALIRFIKLKRKDGSYKHKDMFVVDDDTLQCIINALYNFKDFERNDRLHQHNLYTKEEVEEIREQVFLLYYLLLGSFNVPENYIDSLYQEEPGCIESMERESIYKEIYNWAFPIVKYDIPQNTKVIAFSLVRLKGEEWKICIQALREKDRSMYSTIEWNRKIIYSSSVTNNFWECYTREGYALGLQKINDVLKKILLDETQLSYALKKYDEIIFADMQVIDILYTKEI